MGERFKLQSGGTMIGPKKAEENQKIVDGLLHFIEEETKQSNYVTIKGDPISEECFEEAKKEILIAINTIKTIIERSTGRPFQEIHSQPNVEDEN